MNDVICESKLVKEPKDVFHQFGTCSESALGTFHIFHHSLNTLMSNYTEKMSLVPDDWNGGVF